MVVGANRPINPLARQPAYRLANEPASKPASEGDVAVPAEIVCVDCGGRCGLLSVPEPDWGFQPGDVVAYRCADCGDRWDVEVPDLTDAD